MCGNDSWNFYVFPLVLHAARHARPDIDVHVTVENAGSMMEKFRTAIARALGIPAEVGHEGARPRGVGADDQGEFAPVIDARRFTPYTRKRIFFSTLPPAKDLWTVRGGQPPPWDEGWERRSSSGLGPLVDMPPMMRGRGPCPGVRPSAYQFHPDFLLYSGSMLNIAHYRIILAITRTMPEHVREGFQGIMASRQPARSEAHQPGRERKADDTAQWMHENGVPLGFRAPRANERATAFGMGQYLSDLGLTEKELFDATGNMFDLVRLGCPIKRWVSGEPVPTRSTYVVPPPPRWGSSMKHCAGHPRQRAIGPGSRRCPRTCRTSWVRWRGGISTRMPGTRAVMKSRRDHCIFVGVAAVRMVGTELP